MKKRALLIGINYFGTSCELNGCHNDVDQVHRLLLLLGFNESDIIVMKDDKKDPNHQHPLRPTRDHILTEMKKLVDVTGAGDELFIHYSGHGSYIYSRYSDIDGDGKLEQDEKDQKDETICPVDNTLIVDDELHLLLVEKLNKDAKLRAIFDCCHSGTVLDLRYRWRYGSKHHIENLTQQCIKNDCASRDCIMISGCLDNQTSADAFINNDYAGALTWAFCKSISEASRHDINNVRHLTWKEILYNIRFKLRTNRYEQTPQLSYCSPSQLKSSFDL